MKIDLSVIIPLYNAKDYVFLTIDSLLNQTKKELEVLLVDDCSTDGSPELIKERYKDDSRVRVLYQEKNGGPGPARNRGIEEALGEYITFCDSDDQIKPDCYEKMYAVARAYDADVVHASGCLISMMEETPDDMLTVADEDWCAIDADHPSVSVPTVTTTDPAERLDRWMKHEYHWAIWNKLYRRDLLINHGIRFGKMRLAEDQQFCFNCLFHAKNYVLMPGYWYCYRQVANSACRGKYDAKFMIKALTSAFECSRAMNECGKSIPYFAENPGRLAEATDYVLEGLESAFIRQIYPAMGEEAVRSSSEIHQLFADEFGELADFVEKSFHDAHRLLEKQDDIMAVVNSPSGLRQLTTAGIFQPLDKKKALLAEVANHG